MTEPDVLPRPRSPEVTLDPGHRSRRTATWLAVGLATALAASGVDRLGSAWGYGLLLIAVAAVEALVARALYLHGDSRTVLAAAVANIGLITAYVVGRTARLSIGLAGATLGSPGPVPHSALAHAAGSADYSAQLGRAAGEDVSSLDVAMLVSLLGLVALLVGLLPANTRRVAVNVALLAGIGLWAQRLFGVLG